PPSRKPAQSPLNGAASLPAAPASSKPASNTIGFDPAVRTSTLAFPHRRAKEWRGSGTVEQALDPAILGCQLFEKSCRIGRAITVAIWARGGSARSNLAGKHRQRRLVIDIVPFG